MTTQTASEYQARVQQIAAAVRAAEKSILPAKLQDPCADGPNGHLLAAYLKEHNLDPIKSESFVKAINALYASLVWIQKPAKLVAEEKHDAPKLKENPIQLENDRLAKIKAQDAATEREKAKAASIRQCEQLIENYRPNKFTLGNPRIDHADIILMVPHWKKCLKEALESGQDMAQFASALSQAIQNRYADRERASQRGN